MVPTTAQSTMVYQMLLTNEEEADYGCPPLRRGRWSFEIYSPMRTKLTMVPTAAQLTVVQNLLTNEEEVDVGAHLCAVYDDLFEATYQ